MRRKRSPSKLEEFLAILKDCDAIPKHELAQQFRDTLLRAGARRLFARFELALPERARLFALDELAGRVEGWFLVHAEREAGRTAAVDALLATFETNELPHALGALFETLASFDVDFSADQPTLQLTRRRKKTGMFYTPAAVAREVAQKALQASGSVPSSVCDPACGSGAFLVEAARALAGDAPNAQARRRAVESLVGVDLDRRALLVAELALWAFVADPEWQPENPRLFEGDALSGALDWKQIARDGFELVIGNPPWVAFAGRAAQPLAARTKAYYLEHFASFRGYPTLHALFVERALELAPRGVVALLIPSPVADLDGYRALRRRLFATHEPCEPLLEFGQDAFETVTQPCFALIAKPRVNGEPASERKLRLAERERFGNVAQPLEAPQVLLRMEQCEAFPRELFGELGFQSNRAVSTQLFLRAESARPPFTYPLLEGREVSEFRVGAPRLFLHPDERVLTKTRCKLRLMDDYQRVEFVVRQTAKFPIAALHNGLPFRNTLLAGFRVGDLSPELVVGLLNSSLYRALHLARQRDARQKVFPQVKVAHLRALPRPPRGSETQCERVRELTRAFMENQHRELRRALDDAVFTLFDLSTSEREQVLAFVAERAPELSLKD